VSCLADPPGRPRRADAEAALRAVVVVGEAAPELRRGSPRTGGRRGRFG